ncbi:DUF2256 domain-containing protein [Marisediminicola antarctica]|uniref:DUF2256 domain-containing protein n=1 Tax=Marisediminicola antarctica TaxID=674079 RepID=UPI00137AF77F|nr:DUF2256 domain-containing protein [Marisediminicola antarctica]
MAEPAIRKSRKPGLAKPSGGRPAQTARVALTKNGHPPKTCPVCARPFEWRKKWERSWLDVVYCSDRCRESRKHPELGR